MDAQNSLTEKAHKIAWELENSMRRMGLRNKPGKKPVWKYTEATRAATRKKGKGEVD